MSNWIGSGLKYHRNQQGLTLQELSELSGVDQSSISHAENGDKKILGFENLTSVLNALYINFSDCTNTTDDKQLLVYKIKSKLKTEYNANELEYFNSLLSLLNKLNEDNISYEE